MTVLGERPSGCIRFAVINRKCTRSCPYYTNHAPRRHKRPVLIVSSLVVTGPIGYCDFRQTVSIAFHTSPDEPRCPGTVTATCQD